MLVTSTEAKRSGKICKLFLALMISAGIASTSLPSTAQQLTPHPMSQIEAKNFASAATNPKQRALPGFELEPEGLHDGLYVFNGIWQGLPNGSVEVGFFDVDPITGNVWDPVLECNEFKTPGLRSLQQKRQKQLRLSARQLQMFAVKGPMCSDTSHEPHS